MIYLCRGVEDKGLSEKSRLTKNQDFHSVRGENRFKALGNNGRDLHSLVVIFGLIESNQKHLSLHLRSKFWAE